MHVLLPVKQINSKTPGMTIMDRHKWSASTDIPYQHLRRIALLKSQANATTERNT